MQRRAARVCRHLPAAACLVGSRAHGLQHHLIRCNPQRKAQRAVSIVREEPVVAWPQSQSCSHLQRLVSGSRYLKINLLLPLQQDFTVIHMPGEIHQPVDFNQLLSAQSVTSGCRIGYAGAGNCHSHPFHSNCQSYWEIAGLAGELLVLLGNPRLIVTTP